MVTQGRTARDNSPWLAKAGRTIAACALLFNGGLYSLLMPTKAFGDGGPISPACRPSHQTPAGTGLSPADAGLAMTAEPLIAAVPRLATATGEKTPPLLLRVALRVAWDPVTMFAPSKIAPAELRDHVATLFHFTWQAETDKNGQDPLILDSSAEQRRLEQRLWRNTLDRAIKPVMDLARYAARTPVSRWVKVKASLAGAQSEDPVLGRNNLSGLVLPSSHAALALVDTITLDQGRTLADAGTLVLPWAAMTPRQRNFALASCVRGVGRSFWGGEHALSAETARAIDQQEAEWVRRFGVALFVHKDAASGGVKSLSIGRGDLPGWYGSFESVDFVRSLLPVRGSPYPPAPPLKGQEAMNDATDTAAAPAAVPAPPSYDDLERMPFPAEAAKKVAEGADWAKILAQLSRSVDMPVLSDAFSAARSLRVASSSTTPPSLAGLSLAQGLDILCQAQGYLWWRENGALFFRSRTWFIEKLYEVPPPVLERLSEQTDGGTRLTAEALDTLASLTLHQIEGLAGLGVTRAPGASANSFAAHEPMMAGMDTPYVFPLLELWAQLPPAQKQAVLSESGLPPSALTNAQEQRCLTLVASRYGREALSAPNTLRLHIRTLGQPAPRTTANSRPGELDQQGEAHLGSRAARVNEDSASAVREPRWVSLRLLLSLGVDRHAPLRFPLALPVSSDDAHIDSPGASARTNRDGNTLK